MSGVNAKSLAKALLFLMVNFSLFAAAEGAAKDSIKIAKPEKYSESICPSDDFETFFKIFSNDMAAQKVYANHLVIITEIDVGDIPNVKYSINTVEKNTLAFPLMPNEIERKKQALHFFLSWEKQLFCSTPLCRISQRHYPARGAG